jgi:hypothetical protein
VSVPEQLQPPDGRSRVARRTAAAQALPLPRRHPEVHAQGRDRSGIYICIVFISIFALKY